MKLVIKNFQSISEAVLEFPIGITTIVGPSNSGKTACIRAVYSVLKNPSEAKSFIKRRTEGTEVSLDVGKLKVKWRRTPKDSFYDMGGETLQKVGKTDLFNLTKDIEFYEDEDGNIINIQDEWTTLFPFNRTDSEVYKLFEDVFAINDSSVVLKKIKDNEQDIRKSIADLDNKLNTCESKLGKIESFLGTFDEAELCNMKAELETMLADYSVLDKDCSQLLNCLKTITKVSQVPKSDFDFSIVDNYKELDQDVNLLNKCIKIVNNKIDIEHFDFSIVDNYKELDQDVNRIVKCLDIVNNKIDIEHFDFSIVDNYKELDQDVSTLVSVLKELNDLNNEKQQLDKDMAILKEQLDGIEVCPFCEREMK